MSTIVEIGSLRERVEIIEAPVAPPHERVGRIRHANGENVDIDYATLVNLMDRAGKAGSEAQVDRMIGGRAGNAVLMA